MRKYRLPPIRDEPWDGDEKAKILVMNIYEMEVTRMGFFSSAVSILQTLVTAIGAGLGVWGVINLMEGYGNDNPGAKSQGIKQLMAGGGVILIGTQLVPQLGSLF